MEDVIDKERPDTHCSSVLVKPLWWKEGKRTRLHCNTSAKLERLLIKHSGLTIEDMVLTSFNNWLELVPIDEQLS